MPRQQLGCPDLIVPGKATGTVGRELDIVRRVGINKIVRLDRKFREILVREFPAPKQFFVSVKVSCVIDLLILAEWHVEFAAAIEAAQTVETSTVQIIKKLRRFLCSSCTTRDELIETRAMRVEKPSVIASIDLQRQPATHLSVEIDQVRIDIVQQRTLRLQSKRYRQPTTKRLNIATLLMCAPSRLNVREQPTLTAGPLQRRRHLQWSRIDTTSVTLRPSSYRLFRHQADDSSDAASGQKLFGLEN